ncbi:hypothetical protein F2Q68_00035437 [Brassica cretica]|uniref:Uncharacterized protein n=1 Tax=Brassica cretica TaxID=69181 RepID=A0A8S9H675_BRACR|nr:hypothetical protein F2Q68_00035437 [Brassica cretica]
MDTLHLACHEAEAWKLSQITPYTILEDEAREGGQQANIRQGMTGRWRCQEEGTKENEESVKPVCEENNVDDPEAESWVRRS